MSDVAPAELAKPLIQTTCEACVFAEFEDVQHDPTEAPFRTQTGCRLGRLEKFISLGVPVVEKTTDDGRLVKVVGRICMAARQSSWGNGMTPDEQEAKVREELRFACHVYIPALNATPEEIERTLESFVLQQPQPTVAEVLILGRNRPGSLIMRLKEKYNDRLNWKLTIKNADETTTHQAIDYAVHQCQSPFYGVFHAGSEAKTGFLANLDRVVNDDLTPFNIVPGDEAGNGLVVVTQLHRHLGGNEIVDMVEGDPEQMTDEELEQAPTIPISGILEKVRFLSEKCGVKGLILETKPCQK